MTRVLLGTLSLVFAACFLLPISTARADDTCLQKIETLRSDALSALRRLEEKFRDAGWNYQRSQEIVCTPLWEAVLMRRDVFSKERQTEGEMLYRRYRLLADQSYQSAGNDLETALRELQTIKRGLVQEDVCGGALLSEKPADNISQFNNCASLWNHETGESIQQLEKLLNRYRKKQEAFSELLESNSSDTLSDHDTFEDRYQQHFSEYGIKTQALFLRLVRKIRERFELKWNLETCCQKCEADQRIRWDPVLSQVKPDPQGDSGVGGNLVNNARLKQAFERFEKEQSEVQAESGKKN